MEYPTIPKAEEVVVYAADTKKHWGSAPDSEKPICYAQKGIASKDGFAATTLPQVLIQAAETKPDLPALLIERDIGSLETLTKENGKYTVPAAKPHEDWDTWTFSQLLTDVRAISKAMIKVGLQPHDAVNIYGSNSPEWTIFLLSAVFSGGKAAGIYPSDTPQQLQFKCDHANGAILVVDGQKNFNKAKEIVKNLPYLRAIVSWGDLDSTESLKNEVGDEVLVFNLVGFKKFGEDISDDNLEERISSQKPSQSCCYVYTSGTTGNPKAVMLSHDNMLFGSYAIQDKGVGSEFGKSTEQERILSYLPLCHVAGMMVDIITPLVVTAYTDSHVSVFFARSYDLKTGALVERLNNVKPTLFLGVPRVWEKMADKLKTVTSALTGVKGSLTRWAMSTGNAYVKSCMFEKGKEMTKVRPSPGFLYNMADKLVLSKVREKLGLDCCKVYITGAAPIQYETQNLMASFGITIQEAYGLSETSGGMTWNTPIFFQFGCIGPAFPTSEVKVFSVDLDDINNKNEVPPAKEFFAATEEEQGELCLRGRTVMIGYLANERLGKEHVKEIEQKNMDAIDNEGFLHTGDKGCYSVEGYFKVTGRYKEIIIGAGGENIAPVPIEDGVKAICPIISNIVMIGDKRKFNVALVTLKLEGATGEFPGSDNLVVGDFKYLNTESKTIQEAMEDEKVIKEITDKITAVNKNGKIVTLNAAKIQKFMILPRDLSIVTDDFTATLKLKRGFVSDKFSEVVDLMYESEEVYVPFPQDKYSQYYE